VLSALNLEPSALNFFYHGSFEKEMQALPFIEDNLLPGTSFFLTIESISYRYLRA
jgi:hypothetical protein